MDCNVIRSSLETGNQSAYIFALQSQLVSLQIIVSYEAFNVSWQFNVPAIECTKVRCKQTDLWPLSTLEIDKVATPFQRF